MQNSKSNEMGNQTIGISYGALSDRLHKCSVSCRTIMMLDDTVIVVDNSNYNADYAEKVPFKAKVTDKTETEIWVKSLKTGKEYELYYAQVLEAMDIEDIVKLLDLSKYGS